MKKGAFCIAFTLVLVLMRGSVFAMPASPSLSEVRQPDGSAVKIHIRGDEKFHWYEDANGYTVVCDKGRYAYGRLDKDNRLVATSLTVGVNNPKAAGLQKKVLPPLEVRRSLRPSLMSGSSGSSTTPAGVSPFGTVKNLVVLCKFSNHTSGVHTRAAGDYDILFNHIGGDSTLAPTGSVKDLYLENSYGLMTLQSTVTVWVTLPNTEAYYANGEDGTGSYPKNAQKMVEDALNLVDPLIDFSQFDNDQDGYIDAIDIIHSGYGAETGGGSGNWIWSHQWSLWALSGGKWTSDEGVSVYNYHTEPALWGTSGTSIVRFGVIAHETGHFFGLPDLYDTDGSAGQGVGSWCMMANSWGFDSTQLHPPHFSAWSKIKLGWVTPTVITTPGSYAIGQAETSPQAYRINYGYPSNEYLLIENRQPVGVESAMPQGGLCIYHIDDLAGYNTEGYPGQAGWPTNGNHYRVAVLQADGNYNLEKGNNRGDSGDVFRASGVSEIGPGPGNYPNTDAYQSGSIIVTDNTLHSISASGASMSFVYSNLTVPQPPVAQDGSAGTQINTSTSITLEAADDGLPNPPAALTYIITSLPANGTLSDPCNGDISSVPYSLSGYGSQVVYTPDTSFTGSDSFQFKANDGGTSPDGGNSNTATVTVNVSTDQLIYSATMSTNPGWTYDSLWQWGTPTGSGGEHGSPDPTSGYTGANVIGYNLSGDYENSIASTRWAKTPVIDCTDRTGVTLTFYRWLNVEKPLYDHAYIQVSNNGSGWSTIWENSSGITITDSSWTLQTFDISAIADNQPTVYIRWGLGPTDSSWQYSGWNIDDVKVTGEGSMLSRPPVAQDGSVSTQINTSASITLEATDDGLPNPPAALTYIITSLPINGILSDPCNGAISNVPYSLPDSGNQVLYTPDTSFAGSDSFQFKANDGGTAPDGGDSNFATVSVTVVDLTTIFYEDFESGLNGFTIDNSFGNGNGLWHLSTACNAALLGHTKPTALFYGLDGSCTYDNGLTNQGVVVSPSISLAGFQTGTIELTLNYFLETEGSPVNYDRVSIEISENGGPFVLISHNGPTPEPVSLTDPSITWIETVVDLSAFAGSSIQLRFSFDSVDAELNDFAGFYVDDVKITGIVLNPLPDQAVSPKPANAATNVSLTNDLGWTAGSGSTSHDVYFGTSNPPTFRGNQAGTTYDTGEMDPCTTYYWRIDEKNESGTTTGIIWSFTTAASEVWQSETVNWRVDYGNSWNKTGTVTKPGATAIRLRFNTIDTESGWDHLYSNAGDDWSGIYTNVTSGENSGDSTNLTLTSDTSVTGYFIIDQVDYQGTSAGPAAASSELFWNNGSGKITYDFNDHLHIWDITGTYDDNSFGASINYTLTQDAAGKITGSGDANCSIDGNNFDMSFTIRGAVTQKNNIAAVKLTFKFSGWKSNGVDIWKFKASEIATTIIDTISYTIDGTAKLKKSGEKRETVDFNLTLPDDMDGSASLSIDANSINARGIRLDGDAVLTLSNSDVYDFTITGRYIAGKELDRLTLTGVKTGDNNKSPGSFSLVINDSNATLNSLTGKPLGQRITASNIPAE